MKDFNFFEPYLKSKQRLSKRVLMLHSISGIAVIILISIPIVNQFRINKLEKKAMSVSAIAYSEQTIEQKETIENRKKQIQELEEYYNFLESVRHEFTKIDIINDLFLQTITDRVPQDVFFENINIRGNSVTIIAIAQNSVSIAEFEENLRNLPYFENIFIPSISLKTVGYIFTVSFDVKDGNND